MCTVSWLQREGRYELFCNRDEKKTRAAARKPELMEAEGVRFLAPIDGAAGGTWIAVNEHGLTLCLLNAPGTGAHRLPTNKRSRGHIVMDLAPARDLLEASDRVRHMPMAEYAPFHLVLVERGRGPVVVDWDGVFQRVRYDARRLICSSSFDDAGAQQARQHQFTRMIPEQSKTEDHLAFHRSHGTAASAYSPCMHRADAETVSFTHLQVMGSEVIFQYWPLSPCRPCPIHRSRLSIAS